MRLTMLGTGNAVVTRCYNTCFVLSDEGRHLLVDGGGGSGILVQLARAGLAWTDIHEIFVTHKHLDHLLGALWAVRVICQSMARGDYQGEAILYGHSEVLRLLQQLTGELLPPYMTRHIGERFHFVEIHDGETREVIGHTTTFFDINSTKATQYGFCMDLGDDKRLVCCGDEPCSKGGERFANNSTWLLHEAFCLYSQRETFDPYTKHHSTVRDACELAERLGVENLLLYHTEDLNIANRKKLYIQEGKQYFHGRLWVPDDLDVIEL